MAHEAGRTPGQGWSSGRYGPGPENTLRNLRTAKFHSLTFPTPNGNELEEVPSGVVFRMTFIQL